ncbi:TFIIB-type zinc ribbon-containing protein [Roseateles oligotrophus]|uniref:Zf-TFIIB domain-containing protein n=1 Tax=Roseateles oligotrophus TaxID=1769250 RepID=A0ABT2YI39_9BURK|nr:zf-TFIIB domain-containing protein [Roseateles oligotrophus]MCV2369723.1 zf-TFIIB domain-containing protein [Roseateles oligotrophus]
MKCPRCPASTLAMSERQGVEIDYCPDCRGIWLDRGELDKLLEFAAQTATPNKGRTRADFVDSDYPSAPARHGNQGHQGQESQYGHHARRKKSWLSEFFD